MGILRAAPAAVGRLLRRMRARGGLAPRPVYRPGELPREPAQAWLSDRPLNELAIVVFDTETTGLRPAGGDEIVQIAGVRIERGRLLADRRFNEVVNPRRPIPPSSTRFHGIDDAGVAGRPGAEQVLRRFHAYCRDAVLVGHNVAFDMRFLELKEDLLGLRFDNAVLDTLLLSAVLCPGERDHSLDAMAARFGLPLRGRHSALGDALITAGAFLAIMEIGRQQGVSTLGDALRASRRARRLRRLQRRF